MRSTLTSTASLLTKFPVERKEILSRNDFEEMDEPIWHYIEFLTQLMRILSRSKQDQSVRKNLNGIARSELFVQQEDGKWYTNIDWPFDKEMKTITICAYYNAPSSQYKLEFFYAGMSFLSLSNEGRDLLLIETIKHRSKKNLLDHREIENIIQTMRVFLTPKFVKYIPNVEVHAPLQIKDHSNHFDQKQFSQLVNYYGRHNFTYRVHGVLNHTLKRTNSYLFYLDWEGQQGQKTQLKVKFSFANPFNPATKSVPGYSWVMPESTLLGFRQYEPYDVSVGQLYYKVEVFEGNDVQHTKKTLNDTQDQEITNVLNLWFTADGEVGEIKDVCKGSSNMPGNEVLRVFEYLNLLLRISNIFVCDESTLTGKNGEKIFLRLFLPLVMGKTWYEEKLPGLELFTCNKFVAPDGIISQSKPKRNTALRDLQQLPLNKLYSVLSDNDRQTLLGLCSQYLPKAVICTRRSPRLQMLAAVYEQNQFFAPAATLQELVTAVYGDARSRRTITTNLNSLNALLCRGLQEIKLSEPLKADMSPQWVASRVGQLLAGSTFWVRGAQSPAYDDETPSYANRIRHG